ncbi:AarF/ABC1/UbiB kinase family protein [Parvularcula sp. ZS-1/3]|uniref:AarF/ABC1/UbiB kinase family protein n=1 Tax=Parvularcula mediterranea TaxID=2732508 RepID=A0A7Y3RLT3_9PROT|nr:AarF/ABC1/UbiB kinase family protein [Parvularcula mediterranea]NNU16456.1 AarF/ABC1/UbiB kinase family protein [Parvularcula mediterranea]
MARKERDESGMAVPSKRLGRLARFTGLGTSIAGNVLVEGAKTLARGEALDGEKLLFTPRNAEKVTEQLAQLRGAAMKVGQLMSMGGDDMLPPELAEILARLREQAVHMPPPQLRRVLNEAWGNGWMSKFAKFDPRPIAAASIGQVHRGNTKDGRELAIKVQYPGVRDSIDSDVDNVLTLIKLSGQMPKGVDYKPVFAEAKSQLHEEADYLREGAMMQRFHEILTDDDRFVVPEWHEDLTTTDVLAMSFERGAPIDELEKADQEMRNTVITRLFELVIRELFEFHLIQTDPNFANYRFRQDTGQVVLLDFGATREITEETSQGYRRLVEADLTGDWKQIEAASRALGIISGDLQPQHEEPLKGMFLAAIEPMRFEGDYDFKASNITSRMQAFGIQLREAKFDHTPRADLMFLHRKIGGTYLLAQRLGAKVNVRSLLAQHGF